MPNAIAYLMLLLWPVVMIVLFKKKTPTRALLISVFGAYLLLPPIQANFDFPLFPPLNKESLTSLVLLLICFRSTGRPLRFMPESGLGKVLMSVFVLSPFGTVLTNSDPLIFQATALPGLRITDTFALVFIQALMLVPFILARQMLADPAAQRDILLAFVLSGLVYSIPMLIEIRLSPQLNVWIYGFFQHNFMEMVRSGGFRPIVFLYHGLWVAFFTMCALVSAVALFRAKETRKRGRFAMAAGYLGALLVMCKTLGVLVHAVVLIPLVVLFKAKRQLQIACIMGIIAITYPLLKGADLVPSSTMLSYAESINPERAASLRFRFYNEDALLERAREKPVFGWGSWGRNHIHDPVTGRIQTVTDGRWIIVIGVFGWIGYLAEFGLLTLPLILALREMRHRKGDQISPYIGPLALLLGANMIDMLPNATLTPLTFLLAGALLGYAEALRAARTSGVPAQPDVNLPDLPAATPKRPRTII